MSDTSVIPDLPPSSTTAPGQLIEGPGYKIVFAGDLSVPSKNAINKTARNAQQQQMTVAALDSVLPLPYGQVRVAALLANALVYQGNWVFWVIWCRGPINAFVSFSLNDAALDSSIVGTHYTGAAGQGVDPTLAAAFAAIPGMPTYAETLPGIAYSVFVVSPKKLSGAPQFNAILQGFKVYDPRLDSTNGGTGPQRLADPTTWAYSRNPALILADFMASAAYGDGHAPLWSTVAAVANACDATVGTAPATETVRLCDIVIDKETATASWLETLRTAACCWLVPQGDVVKLVADAAGASVATYDHASGNILQVNGDTLQGTGNLPTVMEIVYTDTSQLPYRDVSVLAKRPGVDAGTIDWRKSTVRMPWITRPSHATREAIERLNKLWLRSLTINLQLLDEGLQHEPGDLITLNYPDTGYSGLQVRAMRIQPSSDGWSIACTKEDPGVYSTTVQTGPTVPNTNLPLPTNVPAPTGLTWVEELYYVNTGELRSRMRATWTDVGSTWPFFAGYRIEVYAGSTLVDTPSIANVPTFAWGPVQENVAYTVNVYTLSPISASAPATATTTALGKLAKPTDVPYLFIYEAAGEVRFQWQPALDLDLAAHELRYGPVGSATWATATLIERVPAPARTYSSRNVPPGNWRFFIKGLDRTRTATYPNGQESVNAKTFDLNVGGDPDLFIAAVYAFTTPTLTNMVATTVGAAAEWVSDYGGTFNSIFPSNLNTYINPLSSYSGTGTSSLVTESFDFGQSYSGLLLSSIGWQDITGTAQVYLEVSPDNVTWTQFVGVSAQVSCRFARVRVQTTGIVLVTSLGSIQLSVAAITETGDVVTSASAWVTVALAKRYAKVKTLQLTADVSAGQRNPGFTNVILANDPRYDEAGFDSPDDFTNQAFLPTCSFDVACWDGLNNQVATPVKYFFSGI